MRGPYEQSSALPTIAFEYHHEAATPWAISRHLDSFRSATDTVDDVIFVDGLGRQIQTKRDATLHTGEGSAALDRMIVSGRVAYDLAGRAADVSYPIDEPVGQPGVFNTGVDGQAPTHTDFDVLDRPTLVRLPDGTTTTNEYGFGADRDGVTRQRTTTTDARYYDPRIGQFMSTDPAFGTGPEPMLDNARAGNVYGYGANNPTRYTDTEGADVTDTLQQFANGDKSRPETGETNQPLRLPGVPTFIPPVARYNLSVSFNGPLLTRDPSSSASRPTSSTPPRPSHPASGRRPSARSRRAARSARWTTSSPGPASGTRI